MLKSKKWIFRSLTTFILIICMFFSKNIFAKDLKFEANVKESNAYIRLYIKQYGNSSSSDWEYLNQRNSSSSQGRFTTYAISFWGNKDSGTYEKKASTGYDTSVSSYDTYNGFVRAVSETPENDLPNYSAAGPYLIKQNSNTSDFSFSLTGDTSSQFEAKSGWNLVDFYRYRSKIYRVDSSHSIVIGDYVVTKSGIEKLLEKYYTGTNKTNKVYVDSDTNSLKLKFSFLLHTNWPEIGTKTFTNLYLNSSYRANAIAHYEFDEVWNGSVDHRRFSAYSHGYTSWTKGYRELATGSSILNYYDNWLYIPLAKLYPRTATIEYYQRNVDGTETLIQTESKQLDDAAQTIYKSSINGKVSGLDDSYYIGGKMASGSTVDAARNNVTNSTNTWGWNKTTFDIPAANSEEHYVIKLYYGKRNVIEKHVDLDGNRIVTDAVYSIGLHESKTLYSKGNFESGGYKYLYKYYNINSGTQQTSTTATVAAVSGGSTFSLNSVGTQTVTFYYKKLSPRTLTIKYMVRNSSGSWNEVKIENKSFFETAQAFDKSSVNNWASGMDPYYIGGKQASGSSTANAQSNLTNGTSITSWGWNTTRINIPASEDNIHYVVELYYGKRNVVEKHVDLEGNRIVTDVTHSIGLHESKALYSKGNFESGGYRYLYRHYKINSGSQQSGTTATVPAISGGTTLNLNSFSTQTVTFYYKKLSARTLTIKYMVRNASGVWEEKYSKIERFWENAQSFNKESINDKVTGIDSYYIGGKQASGSSTANAQSNLTNGTSITSWGWNTSRISIPASEDNVHYVVELYYGKRNVVEKHVDLDGNRIISDTTHSIGLHESKVLNSKGNFESDGYRYLYKYYKINSGSQQSGTTATVSAVSGGTTLNLNSFSTQTVTFYYKKLSARTLTIKYMVRNASGVWEEKYSKIERFWENVQSFNKESINDKVTGIDSYYIGGKQASGSSTANAQTNLINGTGVTSWGWNTSRISIPASEDNIHYVVELYYGKRNVVEKHIDLEGNRIVTDVTHSIGVNEELSRSARTDLNNNENKYIFNKSKLNSQATTSNSTVKIAKIDGSSQLKLYALDTQTITFYYKKIGKRRLTIKYLVKNDSGNWEQVKSKDAEFWETAQSFEKESVGAKDSYYIGGKQGSGTTSTNAQNDLTNAPDKSWGWNTTTITIPASEEVTYYVVELYYDYRTISEYHLKTDGSVINPAWNRVHKPLTNQEITLNAKTPYVYYNNAKYIHSSTEVDGNVYAASSGTTIKFEKLDGANQLRFGDNHYTKFIYEYEPTKNLYVRHFVFNDSTNQYERVGVLTNTKVAIKDGEESKYYLRPNGYNQRKYKSGSANITDTITSGFNEQYSIDFGDTIKLDKSATIENEGILYEYKGVKIQKDSVPSKLTTKAQADTLDKTKTTVTLNPEAVTKVYVDFYYTRSDILIPGEDPIGGDPDDDSDGPTESPTIDFVPQDNSDSKLGVDSAEQTGECKVVYIPSGEYLKSYMTATTYRPYSLIYEGTAINETTGEITYSLKKYDAYKFVDGIIQNNSTSKYGYFNSTEKYGVFNTNSNTSVNPIVTRIDNELKNSINIYKGLNPKNITIVNDGRITTVEDYGNDNIHKVESNKYNGIRKPIGTAYYNVTSLVDNGAEVYNVKVSKTGVSTANDTQVNVFTPATISDVVVETEKFVNHSNQNNSFVIQKNSEFKVTPHTGQATGYMNITNTEKYIKYYWFVADFDVKLLNNRNVYDMDSNQIISLGNGQIVRAGNLIQIPVGGTLNAIATNDNVSGDIINQFSNKLKVVAVTYNVTDLEFEKKIISTIKADVSSSFIDNNEVSKVTTVCGAESNRRSHSSITGIGTLFANQMYDDSHYLVQHTETSKNIGRVYDFKVTDCLDVNFKNVFRKSDTGTVNDLSGIKYFSGVRGLLVYGGNGIQLGANQSNQNNIFADRSNDELNKVATKTILPLGPYKHVDGNYLQAPKLGYRISFDLKTSGVYLKNGTTQRYIKITPSYYYISKDGNTFKENIELYYKNSSGKYVNFKGSGYTIYFKPNDGYRTTYNPEAPELIDMSTKLEALKIGGTSTEHSFILTDSMMSYSDNNFVQAWYGEFKLPNSTIAVDASGNIDINNPLTDGYIGVVFKIECIDKETSNSTDETIISYSQEDKSAGPSAKNTTQWDYEGYLGFTTSNIGNNLNGDLRIQLEKGIWSINNQALYEKVKGTVVLFDTDNKAANDFD